MKREQEKWIEFSCLEAVQPIGLFYIGVMRCEDDFRISSSDIHRIDERDFERVIGIQRELKRKRVTEISGYVKNADATFPTAIILAVDNENVEYNQKTKIMRIRDDADVADIIDGQHRIAGLENFQKSFDLNVTIFVDMDLQDKAMTFGTINLAQTKVNRSLVFNLFAFQKARSPQKTCHQIAKMLHYEEGSPLEGRVKLLGRATGESELQFITQATIVESLLPYISGSEKQANLDRDALRRKRKLPEVSEADMEKYIFRDYFATADDAKIGAVVWNLFEAVSRRWPEAWVESERGYVLNRTTGFTSIMRFLGPLYIKYNKNGALPVKAILGVLNKSDIEYDDLTTDNYKPGSQGSTKLFRELYSLL